MRRLALLAAVPAAVAAAAVLPVAPAQASCAPAVRWQGTIYVAAPDTVATPRPAGGPALRGGTATSCEDTVVAAPDAPAPAPEREVALRRARDVDPRVGVLYAGRLYVTPACGDQLAEAVPAPARLPARCGKAQRATR
jgi:hypothetical protein